MSIDSQMTTIAGSSALYFTGSALREGFEAFSQESLSEAFHQGVDKVSQLGQDFATTFRSVGNLFSNRDSLDLENIKMAAQNFFNTGLNSFGLVGKVVIKLGNQGISNPKILLGGALAAGSLFALHKMLKAKPENNDTTLKARAQTLKNNLTGKQWVALGGIALGGVMKQPHLAGAGLSYLLFKENAIVYPIAALLAEKKMSAAQVPFNLPFIAAGLCLVVFPVLHKIVPPEAEVIHAQMTDEQIDQAFAEHKEKYDAAYKQFMETAPNLKQIYLGFVKARKAFEKANPMSPDLSTPPKARPALGNGAANSVMGSAFQFLGTMLRKGSA